ncbi:hypothetical protein CGCSCA1_v013596 [Colletotrichum siamense]|nr:hypothetical protein CGCSCA1_v013596 [Colletotrichum siamense]
MYLIWDLAQHNTTAQHSTAQHTQHASHPVARVLPPKAHLTSRLHRTALSPQCPHCPPPTAPLSRPPISPPPFPSSPAGSSRRRLRLRRRGPPARTGKVPGSSPIAHQILRTPLPHFSLFSSSSSFSSSPSHRRLTQTLLSPSLSPSLFFGRLVRPVSAPEAASTLSLPSYTKRNETSTSTTPPRRHAYQHYWDQPSTAHAVRTGRRPLLPVCCSLDPKKGQGIPLTPTAHKLSSTVPAPGSAVRLPELAESTSAEKKEGKKKKRGPPPSLFPFPSGSVPPSAQPTPNNRLKLPCV